MGLFSNDELCVLCGGKLGIRSFVGRYDIKAGQICMSCGNKAGYIYGQTNTKSKTLEDVKKEIEEHEKIMEREWEIKERFDPDISVPGGLWIDETNKMFGIEMNCGIGLKKIEIYKYEDLLNYEYLEDGICITRGGMGASLAGGLLFGGTGAIVGSITGKKKIILILKKCRLS
ncbi:hypothetical protein [Dielma fastidiosa]|uniref:hypothetical protein n=1 Tax=Dielma fastidiosa TaxID=1034346 RepID=UPI000E4B6A94|nr:hypothetical protein [Dielma fastidiosa]RHM97863.1 hypothetical protein DWZ33_15005 [Dielma fastidiosa]